MHRPCLSVKLASPAGARRHGSRSNGSNAHGALVARFPRRLFTGDVTEQVAEGEAVLVAVVAPRRAGTAKLTHTLVVHDGPGVARSGEARDLEPGGPAPLSTTRRIELGIGDPRGGDGLSAKSMYGSGASWVSGEEVGVEVGCATAKGGRVDAGDLLAGLGRLAGLEARRLGRAGRTANLPAAAKGKTKRRWRSQSRCRRCTRGPW